MFSKGLDLAISIIAIGMGIYHMVSTQYFPYAPQEHQIHHLMFVLALVFLSTLQKKRKLWMLMTALILASLACTLYVKILFTDLMIRAGYPTAVDVVVSIILVILVLEATRETFGLTIPIIAAVFMGYFFLGQYLPDPFYHVALPSSLVVSWLGVGFNGVFGTSLGVSANYLFLFLLFGGIIQVTGVQQFFLGIGRIAGRKLRGGPAQTAVVSSMLVGTVTGSGMANVGICGPFTIPLMKSVGYRPAEAGAIEAAASSGSQILPPVMGAAAFMMSGVTGIPYFKIALAAFVPALLYYVSIAMYIELRARKLDIRASPEALDMKLTLARAPLFIIPFGVIVYLFMQGHTCMYVAFWSVVSVFITSYFVGFITKERPSVKQWAQGFSTGALQGASIGASCAAIGLIISTVTGTGLGARISHVALMWSHETLWLGAILTMVASIIIGCGVPTLPAYILVVLFLAPMLIRLGVSVLAAHLFCLYFAAFSGLTPPVAVICLPAASIAGSSYMRTAIEASKIALIAFIIPFGFIWNPVLLSLGSDPLMGAVTVTGLLLGLLPLAAVMTAQYVARLNAAELLFSTLTAAALIGSAITANYLLFAAGTFAFILLTLEQLKKRREAKLTGVEVAPKEL